MPPRGTTCDAVVTAQTFQFFRIARRNTAFFAKFEIEKRIWLGLKTWTECPPGCLDGDHVPATSQFECRPSPFNWAARLGGAMSCLRWRSDTKAPSYDE